MIVIALKEDLDQRLEQSLDTFSRINTSFEDLEIKVGLHFFYKKMNKVILKQYVYRNEKHLRSESQMKACSREKSKCGLICALNNVIFRTVSLSFKNTRSRLSNLNIITYIKKKVKKTRSLGEEQVF